MRACPAANCQQQAAGIPVGGDGVRAGLALPEQLVGEETLQSRGELAQAVPRWRTPAPGGPRPARAARGPLAGTSRSTWGLRGRARWTAAAAGLARHRRRGKDPAARRQVKPGSTSTPTRQEGAPRHLPQGQGHLPGNERQSAAVSPALPAQPGAAGLVRLLPARRVQQDLPVPRRHRLAAERHRLVAPSTAGSPGRPCAALLRRWMAARDGPAGCCIPGPSALPDTGSVARHPRPLAGHGYGRAAIQRDLAESPFLLSVIDRRVREDGSGKPASRRLEPRPEPTSEETSSSTLTGRPCPPTPSGLQVTHHRAGPNELRSCLLPLGSNPTASPPDLAAGAERAAGLRGHRP